MNPGIRSILRSQCLAPSLSALLFVFLFPVLDIVTHPVSVMYGDYIPLVIRLSDIYWHTAFLQVAILVAPLLLVVLLLITQSQLLGLRNTVVCVLAPFSLALFCQYLIASELDKYLVDFPEAGLPIPWENVFQVADILGFLGLLLVYTCLAAGLWGLIFVIRRKILSGRCET